MHRLSNAPFARGMRHRIYAELFPPTVSFATLMSSMEAVCLGRCTLWEGCNISCHLSGGTTCLTLLV